jgi:hypothetical protein
LMAEPSGWTSPAQVAEVAVPVDAVVVVDSAVVIAVVAVASVVVAEDSVVIAVVAVASEDVDAVAIEAAEVAPLWLTEATSLNLKVRK